MTTPSKDHTMANETKHTAGPWRGPEFDRADGKLWIGDPTGNWDICEIFPNYAPTPEQAAANARLIAAAPDLLEAAKLARSALDNLMGDSDLPEDESDEFKAMQALSAALSKATTPA